MEVMEVFSTSFRARRTGVDITNLESTTFTLWGVSFHFMGSNFHLIGAPTHSVGLRIR